MPTVAIASEFLDAFARIPRAQQRKVREFTEKFRSNPRGPGINYEKIHAVKDDKVRTVRIDQKYRAVILHPTEGDVYVLVWVDNHDQAMDWGTVQTRRTNRGQLNEGGWSMFPTITPVPEMRSPLMAMHLRGTGRAIG